MAAPFHNAWKILKQGPWKPPEGGNYPPYKPESDPFGKPEAPYPEIPGDPPRPSSGFTQPDIAAQIAMIEAQIQELLQKKALLEALSGGSGEGGVPSPKPYGDPPPSTEW